MDFISINELQTAMEADSDIIAHPISFNVTGSADIRRIFDPISYSKGASIIRMMQEFLGETAFKDALKKYLRDFQYSNAVHDDLWNVMTEFGHKYETLPQNLNVKTIMDTWTLQAGYPILSVTRNGSAITVSQQRYLLPCVNKSDTQMWHIPITYVTQANPLQTTTQHWLKNFDNLTLENAISNDTGHWYYINAHRAGYYRVNYDYESLVVLANNYDKLPGVIIAQLMDDALNLARAEVVTYDIPLTFLMRLRASDVLPWAAVTSGIQYLTYMLNREPAYEHFRVSHQH